MYLILKRSFLKIAIVDDSASVRMMIGICLDELGVGEDEIVEFPSAIHALEDFHKNSYDLVFCDLHMPEMDGYELVKEVNEKMEHFKFTRIVMVSGEEDSSYKKKFQELGVRQFIKKPIQPVNFLHHVTPLIEKIKRKK
jgi:two-component system response regulator YesN